MPPKAQGKAKASAEPADLKRRRTSKTPETALVVAPAPMKKGDVSGMLGYLKYHSDPTKEKDPETLTASAKALAAYARLGRIGKPEFLAKWKNSKKDLGWVNDFAEETKHTQSSHEHVREGQFYGAFILKEMGFEPQGMSPEQFRSRLAKILKESEDYYQYKVQVDRDADGDDAMDKYHYKFLPLTMHSTGTSESSRLTATAEVSKVLKDVAAPAAAKIKLENPLYVQACSDIRILKTGKSTLEKKLNTMLDKISALKLDNEKRGLSPVCDRGTRWQQAIDLVEICIDEIREICYEFSLLGASSPQEECAALVDKTRGKIEEAKAHDDAVKEILKEMKDVKSF